MAKKRTRKKKKSIFIQGAKVFFVSVGKLIWNIIKVPYYIYIGISKMNNRIVKVSKERKVLSKRENLRANYSNFNVLNTLVGDFESWEKKLHDSDSIIGIILGARGVGKSAFGLKTLENIYARSHKKIFAMGFKEESLPLWIKSITSVKEIENNSYVLIDEGGILFSSRKSMSNPNKLLSDLILIARHKNINIIFISQNSSNLDVNILRQADYLVLKPSSFLQKDFERKKIQELYGSLENHFKRYNEDKGLSYIHSDKFCGFVSNPLPSFWGRNLSKSFE